MEGWGDVGVEGEGWKWRGGRREGRGWEVSPESKLVSPESKWVSLESKRISPESKRISLQSKRVSLKSKRVKSKVQKTLRWSPRGSDPKVASKVPKAARRASEMVWGSRSKGLSQNFSGC